MWLKHWKGVKLGVKSPYWTILFERKKILLFNRITVGFIWIWTYIWSISLCKITQLQESEVRPTGRTLPYSLLEINSVGVLLPCNLIHGVIWGYFYFVFGYVWYFCCCCKLSICWCNFLPAHVYLLMFSISISSILHLQCSVGPCIANIWGIIIYIYIYIYILQNKSLFCILNNLFY